MITSITSQGKTLTVVKGAGLTVVELDGHKILLTNEEAKEFAQGFLKLMITE